MLVINVSTRTIKKVSTQINIFLINGILAWVKYKNKVNIKPGIPANINVRDIIK